jgi:hypothetical protein
VKSSVISRSASGSIGGRLGFCAVLAPQGPDGAPWAAALPLIRSTKAVMILFSSSVIVKSLSRHFSIFKPSGITWQLRKCAETKV